MLGTSLHVCAHHISLQKRPIPCLKSSFHCMPVHSEYLSKFLKPSAPTALLWMYLSRVSPKRLSSPCATSHFGTPTDATISINVLRLFNAKVHLKPDPMIQSTTVFRRAFWPGNS